MGFVYFGYENEKNLSWTEIYKSHYSWDFYNWVVKYNQNNEIYINSLYSYIGIKNIQK